MWVTKIGGDMVYEKLGDSSLNYDPCEYPGSKLLFRGPKRALDEDYVAFLGGTDTYGKFIADPFVNQIEQKLGMACVNFGWANAGVDVFLHDAGVLQAAQSARAVVFQVPCAQNMSNRFYSVHPRRNDRFVAPMALMREVFPEVDFSEFHFTRHMLQHLQSRAPDRFSMLRKELQTAWVSRMRLLLSKIENDVVLFWFSKRRPSQDNDSPDVSLDPALVTRPMIEAVCSHGVEVVEVFESPKAVASGTNGMVYSRVEQAAASELLGPISHAEAAQALTPVLQKLIQ